VAKICLNMIVKNESLILAECLDSVRSWISSYVICDTGSTDGTPELIRNFGERHGIPGEVHSIKFEDFSQARNQALEKARASQLDFDTLLLLDADMRLVPDEVTPDQLDPSVDGYLLEQKSFDLGYWNLRLLRRSAVAEYLGSTHEALHVEGNCQRLERAWMRDLANGSNRIHKLRRDLELLSRDLVENPDDARSTFYLAQTLRDSGDLQKALHYYQVRSQMGGWEQESWYAAYMAGRCLLELDRFAEASQRLLEAYARRPQRLEPLYYLAKAHRIRNQYELAWLYCQAGLDKPHPDADELLFIESSIYQWGFCEEASIIGFYTRDPQAKSLGQRKCQQLTTSTHVPENIQALARSNLQYYLSNQAVFTAA
jgi:glycosyltransferase involved in cell wall biosynthesis